MCVSMCVCVVPLVAILIKRIIAPFPLNFLTDFLIFDEKIIEMNTKKDKKLDKVGFYR